MNRKPKTPLAPAFVAPPGYRLERDRGGKPGRPPKYGSVPKKAKRYMLWMSAEEEAAVGELLRRMRGES